MAGSVHWDPECRFEMCKVEITQRKCRNARWGRKCMLQARLEATNRETAYLIWKKICSIPCCKKYKKEARKWLTL